MLGKNKLPIENDKTLLLEYGRAFAWINLIEYVLGELIYFRGNLNLADQRVVEKLLEKKTFGGKIELSKTFLDSELVEQLRTLNEKRVALAHSAVGEERKMSDIEKGIGKYVIQRKNEKIYLAEDFLKEVIELASDLSSKLHTEFTNK